MTICPAGHEFLFYNLQIIVEKERRFINFSF